MKKTIIILLNYIIFNSLNAQTFDSVPTLNSYYQHLIINYNDKLVEATIISDFKNDIVLKPGFTDCQLNPDMGLWVKDKTSNTFKFYKENCVLISEVDTINTVYWFDVNEKDSTDFIRKLWYTYALQKFEEKRLNSDTVKKLRLLYPGEFFNMEKNLVLIKAAFYQDSTIIEKKIISDLAVQDQLIKSYPLTVKEQKIQSLEKQISLLTQISGFECFNVDHYPPLIEYYDGNREYTYISSKRCLSDNKGYQPFEKIILLLWNLPEKSK